MNKRFYLFILLSLVVLSSSVFGYWYNISTGASQNITGLDDNNLVHYWTADEIGGLKVNNSINKTFNLSGTGIGYTLGNVGKINNGISFATTDSDLNTSRENRAYQNISMSAWVNINVTPSGGTYYIVLQQRSDLTDNGTQFTLIINDARKVVCGMNEDNTNNKNNVSTTVLELNSWYHIVCTRGGASDRKIYINGTDVTGAGSISGDGGNDSINPNSVWVVGGRVIGAPAGFYGKVDEISIWNTTLNNTQISQLYNNYAGLSYRNYSFYPVNITSSRISPTPYVNSTDNLSFYCNGTSQSEWLSYNYSIYKNNVSILSNVHFGNNFCFQESANTTNQSGTDSSCLLNYGGGYSCEGTFGIGNECNKGYDGSVLTGMAMLVAGANTYLYINYTKPIFANNNSKWRYVGLNNSITQHNNLSIPSACWNYSNTKLLFRVSSYYINPINVYGNEGSCYNGTAWYNLINNSLNGDSANRVFFEEGMYWNTLLSSSGREVNVYNLSNLRSQDNYTLECSAINEYNSSLALNSSITRVVSVVLQNNTIYNPNPSTLYNTTITLDLNTSDSAFVNVSLIYNGQNIFNSSANTVNNNTQFQKVVFISNISQINFFWLAWVDNVNLYNYSGTINPKTNNFTIHLFDENSGLRLNTFNTSALLQNLDTNQQVILNNNLSIFNFTNLSNGDYYIRLTPSNTAYSIRTYYITINSTNANILNAYLVSNYSLITFILNDYDNGYTISGATMDVSTISFNGSINIGTCISDISGYCLYYLDQTKLYSFVINADGYRQLTGDFLPITSTKTLYLLRETSTDYGTDFFNSMDVIRNVSFNNNTNTFTFNYNDMSNYIEGACLYVYKTTGSGTIEYSNNCVALTSGSISLAVVEEESTTYTAVAYVLYNGIGYYVGEDSYTFHKSPNLGSGAKFRLLLVLLVTLTLILLFIGVSIIITIIITPVPLLLASLVGFVDINKGFAISFMVVAIIITYLMNRRT